MTWNNIYNDEVDYKLLAILKDKYFKTESICIDPKNEGQGIKTEDNGLRKMYLGTWAGTQAHISNLCHEMCHFVEIDRRRMSESGFGFKYGKETPFNTRYFVTDQAVWREMRVWAYQYNLQCSLGIETDLHDLVSSCVYLEPLYIFCSGSDDKQIAKVEKTVKKLISEYSLERFNKEWFERILIVEERFKRRVKRIYY